MTGEKMIRNSTADFLIFLLDGSNQGVQVYVQDETVWLTQKAMATLFNCTVSNINMHLKSIFNDAELDKDSVVKDFLITAS